MRPFTGFRGFDMIGAELKTGFPLIREAFSMRILLVAALITVTCLGLSACNTVSGFGKDLESAGHTIQSM